MMNSQKSMYCWLKPTQRIKLSEAKTTTYVKEEQKVKSTRGQQKDNKRIFVKEQQKDHKRIAKRQHKDAICLLSFCFAFAILLLSLFSFSNLPSYAVVGIHFFFLLLKACSRFCFLHGRKHDFLLFLLKSFFYEFTSLACVQTCTGGHGI